MSSHERPGGKYADRLEAACQSAAAIARSGTFQQFVEEVRAKAPWRFNGVAGVDRYLHGVDHHLAHFVPRLLRSVDGRMQSIFDFGCGSGAGSVALAMMFPEMRCRGTDINAAEVAIAHARARLYGVADRCQFECIGEGHALPVASDGFDLCICCSVLAVDTFALTSGPERTSSRLASSGATSSITCAFGFQRHEAVHSTACCRSTRIRWWSSCWRR